MSKKKPYKKTILKEETTPAEEKIQTILIGGVELPIGKDENNPHIPKGETEFIDNGGMLKLLAEGIRDNKNILIIGESGIGKTSAVKYISQLTKQPLRRVNLNGGTTADELVGRNGINKEGTFWIDGPLTEAVRNGWYFILDEINAATAEVLFVLQCLLEKDGYLTLNEKPGNEIVRKHPNFRVFATCNPSSYAGTQTMNTATLSRFQICKFLDFPTEEVEKKIIETHLGKGISQNPITDKIIKLANTTREAKRKENGENYCINTRDILNTLSLCKDYTPIEALKLAFINKLEERDKNAFYQIAILQLPKHKISENEIPIDNIESPEIGDTLIAVSQIDEHGIKVDSKIKITGHYYLNGYGKSEKKETGLGKMIGISLETEEGPKSILLTAEQERIITNSLFCTKKQETCAMEISEPLATCSQPSTESQPSEETAGVPT